MICGPDIKQTTNIVVPLIEKISQDAPNGLIKRTKSENKWYVGQSELRLGGFDTVNINSHRGSEFHDVLFEESRDSNPDRYVYGINEVIKPTLLHTNGQLIHLTTYPNIPGHPFITETIPEAEIDNALFKFNIYDNPLLTLEQIEQAKKDCGGEDTTAFKVEYLCEFVKDEVSTVFPEYNPKIHFKDFISPKLANYIVSIDFGGIRDKTVALLCGYDFANAIDVVIDERVFDINTDTKTIITEVKNMEDRYKIIGRYGDSSGQLQVDCSNIYNYYFTLPKKDDVDSAINNVRLRFIQNKILIHSKCKFLNNTLQNAQYNDNRTDFMRTLALGHNDAGMALTYGIRMLDRANNPYKRESSPDALMPGAVYKDEMKPFIKKFGTFKNDKAFGLKNFR